MHRHRRIAFAAPARREGIAHAVDDLGVLENVLDVREVEDAHGVEALF